MGPRGPHGPGVKLTLSKVAAPSLLVLCEHSNMPTVAEVVIVGKDLFTSAAVHVTPSGLRYALKLAPERTSFIHKFGYAYVAWVIEPLKLY